jgi:4-hydroxy-tetrahydrodipicolinate reductase
MTARHRLIFWGPGHIGGAVLREVLQQHADEYEVVGARVYSPAKDGRDIGELVGLEPIGVAATTDADAILALEADCVVYTPQPLDPPQVTADAIALLRSGKNVVTTTTFHFPLLQGTEYVERVQEACRAGEATVHGTGVHPNFMVERLVMTLTGLFTDVRHIRLVEACESSKALAEMAPEFLAVIGFGQPLEQITPAGLGAMLVNPYYHGVIAYTANALYGAEPGDVRFEHEHFALPADRDYAFPNVTIAEGTAMTLVHVHRGYLGDHHFFTNEEYYYVGEEHRTVGPQGPPFGPYRGDSNYVVEVQGEPNSLSLQLDFEATRDDEVPVVTYLSVVPLLQSIRTTIDAEPGILHSQVEPHFRARRIASAAHA